MAQNPLASLLAGTSGSRPNGVATEATPSAPRTRRGEGADDAFAAMMALSLGGAPIDGKALETPIESTQSSQTLVDQPLNSPIDPRQSPLSNEGAFSEPLLTNEGQAARQARAASAPSQPLSDLSARSTQVLPSALTPSAERLDAIASPVADELEVESLSIESALDASASAKNAKLAKRPQAPLMSGADFIAAREAPRPKLREDAILDAVRPPMQAVAPMAGGAFAKDSRPTESFEASLTAVDSTGAAGITASGERDRSVATTGPALELVPQGAAGSEKYRLRAESTQALAQAIGVKAQSAGGGEIRIRLRPDNLGELRVQVRTIGREVELKFEAKDDQVKAALESALGDLKDRLGAQNLNLNAVDVQVARDAQSAFASSANSGDGQSPADSAWSGAQFGDSSPGRQSRGESSDREPAFAANDRRNARASGLTLGARRSAPVGDSRRLDVQA